MYDVMAIMTVSSFISLARGASNIDQTVNSLSIRHQTSDDTDH